MNAPKESGSCRRCNHYIKVGTEGETGVATLQALLREALRIWRTPGGPTSFHLAVGRARPRTLRTPRGHLRGEEPLARLAVQVPWLSHVANVGDLLGRREVGRATWAHKRLGLSIRPLSPHGRALHGSQGLDSRPSGPRPAIRMGEPPLRPREREPMFRWSALTNCASAGGPGEYETHRAEEGEEACSLCASNSAPFRASLEANEAGARRRLHLLVRWQSLRLSLFGYRPLVRHS
jgi:hypothetical protein